MQLRLAAADEKLARDALTHSAWGQRLTVAQYLERERRLRSHAWAREAMRTWLLVDGGVVASCETFAMNASLAGKPGVVEGVASVFVEDRLRGRGLASEMFRHLIERLRAEGAFASILYSDVGEALYSRLGYVSRPAFDRVFGSAAGNPAELGARIFDEHAIASELAAAPRPDDALLVWPSALQLDWHLERERAYAALLGKPRPRWHGAAAGNSRAFWCGDLKNDRLVILLLAAEPLEEATALIEAARRVAHQAELGQVVLWEYAAPFELPGERVPRAESIPMICPLASGVAPGDWGQTTRATWI